jgi:hypothetical protein
VTSRKDVHRKLWSKNVLLAREPKKKQGKRNSSAQNDANEERRPNPLEVDATEMNAPESADIRLRIGNQRSETLRQLQNQKSIDTGLRTSVASARDREMSTIYGKCQHRQRIQRKGDIVEVLVGILRGMRNPRKVSGRVFWARYNEVWNVERGMNACNDICMMLLSNECGMQPLEESFFFTLVTNRVVLPSSTCTVEPCQRNRKIKDMQGTST